MMRLLWTALAMLCAAVASMENGGGYEGGRFIEDYFYTDNESLATPSDAGTPGVFVGDSVILSIDQASTYKEFILHESRTQDVVVFMSTSPDANLVFERAVRRLDDEALSTTRFFALPLPPSSSTPSKSIEEFDNDESIVSFKALHNLPSIPESGLHIIVTYPSSGSRSLAVHANNAKMVQASTSEDEWVSRLHEQLTSSAATSPPRSTSSSAFSAIVPIGIVLYVAVVLIPSIAAHWQWWVALAQSKRLWFSLSLLGLYLSLSGSFYSLIHGAPLFHLSGQGFALLHPQAQRQFTLEGMFGGMLPIAISAAVLTITHGMPYLLNPDHRFHSVVMCGMVIGIAFFFEHALFTAKNRWYGLFMV